LEGRRSKRVKPSRQVTVSFRFTGDIIDLSASGVLVRCSRSVELGTEGQLAIEVGNETFQTAAIVRRQVPGVGLAFQFTDMSSHDQELLHRLLRRLAQTQEM
jgi:hypothetical protein